MEAGYPLPKGFKELFLAHSSGPLHIVRGGDGPPLIWVHGLGGCTQDFYLVAPALASHYTCILVDLPGFGRSARPLAPYTPRWFAGTLMELAAELGITSAGWVGHSMGGGIVLLLGAMAPGLVASVAAICPSGGHERASLAQSLVLGLVANRKDRLRVWHPWVVKMLVRRVFTDPSHPACERVTARVLRDFSGPDRPAREAALIRSAREILARPVWPELGPSYGPRAMIVMATHDRVIPLAEPAHLASRLGPKANAVVLAGDHMLPYTAPGPLAEVLVEFFERTYPGG